MEQLWCILFCIGVVFLILKMADKKSREDEKVCYAKRYFIKHNLRSKKRVWISGNREVSSVKIEKVVLKEPLKFHLGEYGPVITNLRTNKSFKLI